MQVWLRMVLMCVMCVRVGVAGAAPGAEAEAKYKAAAELFTQQDFQQALVAAEEGLVLDPKHVKLIGLRAATLFELRDYAAALPAYQAYLATGITGDFRREAREKIKILTRAQDTFLEIITTAGAAGDVAPAAGVQVSLKTEGLFCVAEPTCKRQAFPRVYKVEAERAGFERWTGSVTVEAGKTTTLEIKLTELPSQLTVVASPASATVTVDGQAYAGPMRVTAGPHKVVVVAADHESQELDVVARGGQAVALSPALSQLLSVRVSPAELELTLDGQRVQLKDGKLAVSAGAKELVGRAKGFKERRVRLPDPRDPAKAIELTLQPEVAVVAGPAPASGGLGRRRKLALVAAGVGVAALGTGVALGLKSGQLEDDAYELCPVPTDCARASEANSLIDRGQSRATQANLAYGVAAGALVGGAVLWLLGGSESPVAVSPRVAGGAGIDLMGRF